MIRYTQNISKQCWKYIINKFTSTKQTVEMITEIEVDFEDQAEMQRLYKRLKCK